MEQYSELVSSFHESVAALFSYNGLDVLKLTHRIKSTESIERKKTRDVVNDIVGFRALLKTEEECHRACELVKNTYETIPGRTRDYISTPWSDGYMSIHMDLVFDGQVLELQIRTPEMDEVAKELIRKLGAYYWYNSDFKR